MAFTVDLTDTRLFSGLYETIWLNYESLSDEDDIPLEIYEDHHATKDDDVSFVVTKDKYLNKIAEAYCTVLAKEIADSHWLVSKIWSPEFYNYGTDHIVLEWKNAPDDAEEKFQTFLNAKSNHTEGISSFELYDVYYGFNNGLYGYEILPQTVNWTVNGSIVEL